MPAASGQVSSDMLKALWPSQTGDSKNDAAGPNIIAGVVEEL